MAFAVMNVVTTTPGTAATLGARIESTDLPAIKGQPGLLSVRVYRAEDDTQIVTITEWRSREDFLAFRQSEAGKRLVAGAVGSHPKIAFYEVVAAIDAR